MSHVLPDRLDEYRQMKQSLDGLQALQHWYLVNGHNPPRWVTTALHDCRGAMNECRA